MIRLINESYFLIDIGSIQIFINALNLAREELDRLI